MSQDEASLEELARAFVHMLPASGDVLLHSRSPADAAILRREAIFTLHVLPPIGARERSLEIDLLEVRRDLDIKQIPLPPHLFAGTWLRLETKDDEYLLRSYLRLLAPRGLMLVVAPKGWGIQARVRDMSSDQRELPTQVLGAVALEGLSQSEAILLISQKTSHDLQQVPDCTFCFPSRFTVNKCISVPGAAAVLWGDEEFLLMPDVAPIECGHLLLTSTRHYLSIGAIPSSSYARLEDHVLKIDRLMRRGFGKPALFIEHGATRPHEAGSCIDHAHWHCLPDAGTIIDDLARIGMRGVIGPLTKTREFYDSHNPYFLVRCQDQYRFFPADNLPCQFLRLIASNGAVHTNPRWQHVLTSRDNRERFSDTLRHALPAADAVLRDVGADRDIASSEETTGA